MENLKKEARYEATPYFDVQLTDVLTNETGTVKFYYDKGDETWYEHKRKKTIFFTSEAEAINYVRSFIPSNLDQVKDYIDFLHWYDSDKLKEILPECVLEKYEEGRKYGSYGSYSYRDVERIKKALSGNICINGVTFRASQVSHIKHVSKDKERKARIILQDGTMVETYNEIDREIICAIFGSNESGRSFTL